jgi:pimeloyl-ACP methyl ester carboxylesterase
LPSGILVRTAVIVLIGGGILAGVAAKTGRLPMPLQWAAPALRKPVAIETPCSGVRDQQARCYRVDVPEARGNPLSRTIGLRVVVWPATGAEKTGDPVFFLAGGPGQAVTELIHDRGFVDPDLRQRRDLVFADQRGTGGSQAMTCRFYGPPSAPQSYFQEFLPLDKVRACRETFAATADLAEYTTSASVEDLDDVRAALGYAQINLVGVSYGTRLAMEYVRKYESAGRVRAVVLEGPVTPAMHVPDNFGQSAQRALDTLLDECLASESCAEAYPDIREEARAVFDRLSTAPVIATASHPALKVAGEVTLTRNHAAEAIRYMMYTSSGASMVPLYLHEAFAGNYTPIAEFLIHWRQAGSFDGLYLSITCAEDVPYVSGGAAERDDPTFLGGYRVREQRAACLEWPRGKRPEVSMQPVTSNLPVLILSGVLDPVTRPENGDELARTLPNSLHIRVPFGGHSPAGLTNLYCLTLLKRVFLDHARVGVLDTTCVNEVVRPGFGIATKSG